MVVAGPLGVPADPGVEADASGSMTSTREASLSRRAATAACAFLTAAPGIVAMEFKVSDGVAPGAGTEPWAPTFGEPAAGAPVPGAAGGFGVVATGGGGGAVPKRVSRKTNAAAPSMTTAAAARRATFDFQIGGFAGAF